MTPNMEKKLRNMQWEPNVSCGALFDTSCQSSIVLGLSRALIKQSHARSLASNTKYVLFLDIMNIHCTLMNNNEGSFAIMPTIYHWKWHKCI